MTFTTHLYYQNFKYIDMFKNKSAKYQVSALHWLVVSQNAGFGDLEVFGLAQIH